jgi:hypothetical protein
VLQTADIFTRYGQPRALGATNRDLGVNPE